ncbi:MAG TPA: hypothetical protein PK280_11725 [Planctomycetota bacterium]|nr:hypothetical protein [Planctomycetota bacterium]
MRMVLAALFSLCSLLAVAGEPFDSAQGKSAAPGFAKKPAAVKKGEATEVSFAVSAPTDVEVAVLAADGKVARHLAAGVLGGKNPPPEPLKAGLAQEFSWDGKDDGGKPAAGGPFRFRVRLGMTTKFGRILGSSPYTGEMAWYGWTGLATDHEGNLYVKMTSAVWEKHDAVPWQLRKFDKGGKYVKTLLPYAPSTEPAKAPAFKLIDAGDGLLTPAHTSLLDVTLFRLGNGLYNKVVDGSVVFVDNEKAVLTFHKVDGTNAMKVVPMRTSPDKLKWAKWITPQVAFSPDGKYAYYSNLANTPYDGKKPSDIDPAFPQGRIYRQDLSAAGSNPEKFYDLELPDFEKQKYWMPSAWDKKSAAAGIAVDAKGNIFVCDLVNQEVVELSPEGKKLSAAKVPWPDRIIVNSKTGDRYVVSRAVSRGGVPPAELLKLSGQGADAKVAAKFPLKGAIGQSLALDESGAVPVLWLGGGTEVLRLEDRGAEFALQGGSLLNPSKDNISFVCYGEVDAEAELVYVTSSTGPIWRYNGETGEGGLLPIKGLDVAVGPGGTVHTWGETGSYGGPVARYTRELKPLPAAATGKNTYGSLYGRAGRGNNAPGMAVDNRGWVYAMGGFNHCVVYAYDADGRLADFERKARADWLDKQKEVPVLISHVVDRGGSLRVDSKYNVYVLEIGLPKGFTPPKGFEKDPYYTGGTGTIYKFTPKGGEFRNLNDHAVGEVVGAVQTYPDCGPNSGGNLTESCCHCMRPRFGLDGYGRLYIPNGITYKVSVRDNADNELTRFGGYGNYDAQGPKSTEPKPEIPLGWPVFAQPSEKYIYVGDGLNHRVVRVDKAYAAEETAAVP